MRIPKAPLWTRYRAFVVIYPNHSQRKIKKTLAFLSNEWVKPNTYGTKNPLLVPVSRPNRYGRRFWLSDLSTQFSFRAPRGKSKHIIYNTGIQCEIYRHRVPYRGYIRNPKTQCSGTGIFWNGSGSADPYLWLTDPGTAPDPALFVSDLQDAN